MKYLGKHPERGYHRYRVRRAGASAEVDWASYANADRDEPPFGDELSGSPGSDLHPPVES